MKKYLLCFLLFCIGNIMHSFCYGQENQVIVLKGVVIDADSLLPLPYVHIRTKNLQLANATEVNGQFNVRVHLQDTIIFTSIGYKPFQLIPADSSQQKLEHLVITMTPQVYQLHEVSVKAYEDLTKYIRYKDKPLDMRMPEKKPLFERKEPKATPAVKLAGGMNGASLEGGLSAFANLFNSKFQQEKKLRKLLEIEGEEKQRQYLTDIMTEKYQEMLLHVADLNQADVRRFTKAYMPDPNVMVNMNDYTIVAGIIDDLRRFVPTTTEDVSVEEISKRANFEGDKPVDQ